MQRRESGLLNYLIRREYGIAGTRGQNEVLKTLYENWHSQEIGTKLKTVVRGARSIFAVACSADNEHVACATAKHDVIVLKVQPKISYHATLTGHARSPVCLAFHPINSCLLVSGSLDRSVILWDVDNGKSPLLSVWKSDILYNPISSVSFNPVQTDILLVATLHSVTCLCVSQSALDALWTIHLPIRERIVGMAKFHPTTGELLTATRAVSPNADVLPQWYPSGFCCQLHLWQWPWDNSSGRLMRFSSDGNNLIHSGAYVCSADSCSMNGDFLACMYQQFFDSFEIVIISTSPKSRGTILAKVKRRLQVNSLSLSSSGLLLLSYTNFAYSTGETPWHWGIMRLKEDTKNENGLSYSMQCVVAPFTPYSVSSLFNGVHNDPAGVPNNAQWLPSPIMGVVWGTSTGMLCVMSNYYSR